MHLRDLSHPNQLHGLSTSEPEEVAAQIRQRHLEVVSNSGGHLGPGLGVVELTLALYQTLDLIDVWSGTSATRPIPTS